MRICVTVLCVLTFLAPVGRADDVWVGRLPYSNVTIVGVKGGMVTFTLPSGQTQSKPFSDISKMAITGLDSFNQAEGLVAGTAGASAAAKIAKDIDKKQKAIDEIKSQIADQPGARKKVEDQATKARENAAACKEKVDKIDAILKKHKDDAAARLAESTKIKKQASAIQTQIKTLKRTKKPNGWQNQVKQLEPKLASLVKQLENSDPATIKQLAAKKRFEARKLSNEARAIAKSGRKDAKKQAQNKKNQANQRAREAAEYEKKLKRFGDEALKKKTEITKLTADSYQLKRSEKAANRDALAAEKKVKTFPEYIKKVGEKVLVLGVDLDELKKQHAKLAGAANQADRFSKPIGLYQAALARGSSARVRTIVSFRLLNVLDRAGWIDQAVTQWLKLADNEKVAAVFACRPDTIAAKGDRRNATAILSLKTRLSGIRDAEYRDSVRGLLGRLLVREERFADVIALYPKPATAAERLIKANALLGNKDYAQAEKSITAALDGLKKKDLPEALSIRGKARLALSASAVEKSKKQYLMVEAGRDFMKVWTFFQASPQGGESLFLAGKIMATLPEKANSAAAARAYRVVASNYAGTPLGKKASAELQLLKAKR